MCEGLTGTRDRLAMLPKMSMAVHGLLGFPVMKHTRRST
jgi:hypothetical protein